MPASIQASLQHHKHCDAIYRIHVSYGAVGIFLLKGGCFQFLYRDSYQDTVTVSETLNIMQYFILQMGQRGTLCGII